MRRYLVATAGLLVVASAFVAGLGACGDDDDAVSSTRDAATEIPPAHLPPATNADAEPFDAGPDVRTLYPAAWDRSMSARDASLEASVTYCSPTADGIAQFCWDFTADDGITGWNEVIQDGGVHELVGNAGDPLRALRSSVLADAGAGPKWVALRYLLHVDDVPDAAAGLTLSFSFRVASSQTYAILGALQIGTSAGPQLRGLAVYPDECGGHACLGETMYSTNDTTRRVPFDSTAWYRARMTLTPIGFGTGTLKWASQVTVGDKVVAEHIDDALPENTSFPATVNLYVGAFDTTVAGNNQVEIDDILVE